MLSKMLNNDGAQYTKIDNEKKIKIDLIFDIKVIPIKRSSGAADLQAFLQK